MILENLAAKDTMLNILASKELGPFVRLHNGQYVAHKRNYM